jgi:hypothetical protein
VTGSVAQAGATVFDGVGPISRFAYLVSLLPAEIVRSWPEIELRSRRIALYTDRRVRVAVERTPAAATAAVRHPDRQ